MPATDLVHARRSPRPTPHNRPDHEPQFAGENAAALLLRLVDRAAALEPDDTAAMTRLQAEGHRVTARLVAAGALPPYLLIELHDPPTAVLRALARAARRYVRR